MRRALRLAVDPLWLCHAAVENEITDAQIWRSLTGESGTWTQVNVSGFGSPTNIQVGKLVVFNGNLYVGTRNLSTGAQLWRSENGTDWHSVMTNGFGDINNQKVETLFVFEGALYAFLDNAVTGMEVWQSHDGTTWHQVNTDGFGDSNNKGIWANEVTNFNNHMYLGVHNDVTGVEIWRYKKAIVYLPVIIR